MKRTIGDEIKSIKNNHYLENDVEYSNFIQTFDCSKLTTNQILHNSSKDGKFNIVQILIKKFRINVNEVNKFDIQNTTCLQTATIHNHLNIVELLLNSGADATIPYYNGLTFLHVVINNKNINLLKIFLEYYTKHNISIDCFDSIGYTPLHQAVLKQYSDSIVLLLKYGANVNLRTRNGTSATHIASYVGNYNIAKLLVSYNADIAIIDNKGNSPISVCTKYNNQKLLNYLLEIKNKKRRLTLEIGQKN